MLDRWGRETVLLFFMTAHWRSPIDFSDERMAAGPGAGRSGLREVFRNPSEPAAGELGAFQAALDDDFNTPAALAILHEWRRDHELLERALDVFGLSGLAPRRRRRPSCASSRPSAQEARAAKDFARADELRDRDRGSGLGGARRRRGGYRLVPRQ